VFSDNRPELVQPYFPIVEQMVDLGKWRIATNWSLLSQLPPSQFIGLPGSFTNDFALWPDRDGMMETPNGTGLKGIEFPGVY
jgi:hypothetical protein